MDILHLTISNEAPDAAENIFIRQELRVIGDQIAGLRHQLQNLENQEQLFRKLISPVRVLPLEVLGEILYLSVTEGEDWVSPQAVVDCCLVCKSWRKAALLDHRLWRSLQLTVESGQPSLSKLSTWLSRSGDLPRSVTFTGWHGHDTTNNFDDCKIAARRLADVLVDGPIIHSLSLWVELPDCFTHLIEALDSARSSSLSSTQCPWDGLSSLVISIRHGWGWFVPYFPKLPPVTSFELWLPEMYDTFRDAAECERYHLGLSAPFLNRLTRLVIRIDWTINHLLPILKLCTNLQGLTINFDSVAIIFPSENPISPTVLDTGIVLPTVRRLRLEYAHATSLLLLPLLRMPNILRLEADFSRWDSESSLLFNSRAHHEINSGWLPFAQQHRHLKALRISNVTIDPMSDFKVMFAPLSSLTSLTFDNVVFDPTCLFVDIPPVFGDEVRGGHSFAKLQTLEILNASREFNVEPVFTFFASPNRRMASSPCQTEGSNIPLNKLKIGFHQSICQSNGEQIDRWRQRLLEMGVNIDIGPKH
ncbi:hypothetical protein NMY22_g4579 [Coprinellus aureogranulatus]|nr:hypothetical protein NMY22_g4579 [Coprinellus aureogranulatus]